MGGGLSGSLVFCSEADSMYTSTRASTKDAQGKDWRLKLPGPSWTLITMINGRLAKRVATSTYMRKKPKASVRDSEFRVLARES